jgi:hypothetical protein
MYKKLIFTFLLIIIGSSSLSSEQWEKVSDDEIKEFRQYIKHKDSKYKWNTAFSGLSIGSTGFAAYGLHSKNYDVSLGLNIQNIDNGNPTNLLSFILKGGVKYKQQENLYTKYGFYWTTTSGTASGYTIDSNYEIGLISGFEYSLSENLFLESSLVLLAYSSTKINNIITTTSTASDRLLLSVKYVY